jgi:thiaminase/transcriptional activator TenA
MSFSDGLKEKSQTVWENGYNHPFVQELGAGTLDKEKFKFYLLQDYLYLFEYAKVFAMAAVKSDNRELMALFTQTQHEILNVELNLHREYMKSFGITESEIESAKPSLYNRAYTANMLSFGLTGGLAELLATVFPCAWTYSDYAKRLKIQYADVYENNFYKSWIDNYSSKEFEKSFDWFFGVLDNLVENMNTAEKERITEIFVSSVEFEYLFWDMAYKYI